MAYALLGGYDYLSSWLKVFLFVGLFQRLLAASCGFGVPAVFQFHDPSRSVYPDSTTPRSYRFCHVFPKCYGADPWERGRLGDILGFVASEEELFAALETVLEKAAQFGLKLSAKKSELFKKKIKWCEKIITEKGVKQDPERLDTLKRLGAPEIAADLSNFWDL